METPAPLCRSDRPVDEHKKQASSAAGGEKGVVWSKKAIKALVSLGISPHKLISGETPAASPAQVFRKKLIYVIISINGAISSIFKGYGRTKIWRYY